MNQVKESGVGADATLRSPGSTAAPDAAQDRIHPHLTLAEMPADTAPLPPTRLRAARALALAAVLLMLLVVVASAWLRLAQPRPACGDWPGCRSTTQPVLASAAPALLGQPGVLKVVRATHRVAASTVLLLVIALVALALVRAPRVPSLARRTLAMLALALALAALGVVSAGARSAGVLLGNLLGGLALLATGWATLRGLHTGPLPGATLARWAAAGALCWLAQAVLGALAGARLVEAAPVLHLGLALLAGPWALAVGFVAARKGCAAEGRSLVVLASLQMLLGAAAATAAATPALVLLHNALAAIGVALLVGLASARTRVS